MPAPSPDPAEVVRQLVAGLTEYAEIKEDESGEPVLDISAEMRLHFADVFLTQISPPGFDVEPLIGALELQYERTSTELQRQLDLPEEARDPEVIRLLRIQIQAQRALQELLMRHRTAGDL